VPSHILYHGRGEKGVNPRIGSRPPSKRTGRGKEKGRAKRKGNKKTCVFGTRGGGSRDKGENEGGSSGD